jgi:hypothetical protein
MNFKRSSRGLELLKNLKIIPGSTNKPLTTNLQSTGFTAIEVKRQDKIVSLTRKDQRSIRPQLSASSSIIEKRHKNILAVAKPILVQENKATNLL